MTTRTCINNHMSSLGGCLVVLSTSNRVIVRCPNTLIGASLYGRLLRAGYLTAMRSGRKTSHCYVRAFI